MSDGMLQAMNEVKADLSIAKAISYSIVVKSISRYLLSATTK